MLVSEIGYFSSNSKNSYKVDSTNKVQTKSNLSEGFGNVNNMFFAFADRQNLFTRLLSSVTSIFTSKSESAQKYLDFIA
ncbi:hypothetical protein HDR58_09895 [bacterium]|nr:hypothetical protein [bacterium]